METKSIENKSFLYYQFLYIFIIYIIAIITIMMFIIIIIIMCYMCNYLRHMSDGVISILLVKVRKCKGPLHDIIKVPAPGLDNDDYITPAKFNTWGS